ncbi:MAG: zinc metalloprotease HtpX [Proteobacteria bacterium]|nr:zinc metalloprotease HtpX [Pseudomonadota bacterium]
MKRVLLFLATNIAVLLVLSVTLHLLGIDTMLNEQGGLNMTSLLIMAAVLGMGGSFISLAMSKWMASGWSRPCAAKPRRPVSACRRWRFLMPRR